MSVSCCRLVDQYSKTHRLRNRFFSTLLSMSCWAFIRYTRWKVSKFQRLGTDEQDQLCLLFLPLFFCGSPWSASQDPSGVRRHGLKTTAPNHLNQHSVEQTYPQLFPPLGKFLAVRHNASPKLFCPSNIVLSWNCIASLRYYKIVSSQTSVSLFSVWKKNFQLQLEEMSSLSTSPTAAVAFLLLT